MRAQTKREILDDRSCPSNDDAVSIDLCYTRSMQEVIEEPKGLNLDLVPAPPLHSAGSNGSLSSKSKSSSNSALRAARTTVKLARTGSSGSLVPGLNGNGTPVRCLSCALRCIQAIGRDERVCTRHTHSLPSP